MRGRATSIARSWKRPGRAKPIVRARSSRRTSRGRVIPSSNSCGSIAATLRVRSRSHGAAGPVRAPDGPLPSVARRGVADGNGRLVAAAPDPGPLSTRPMAPMPAMSAHYPETITVVDSHTEGEPTRVVVDGWPLPAGRTMAERRAELAARHDHLRRAVVREPRGHDAVVRALLTPPVEPGSAAGVIFFNNMDYLGMCGHGLIGVVRTLAHLGRLSPGVIRIDTPAGTVGAEAGAGVEVTIRNVPAYCHALDVEVDVPGVGRVVGDIAYGGNWFFITRLLDPPLELARLDELLRSARAILAALRDQDVTGAGGAEIDHVELTGPPAGAGADARNFVLCPGGA